MSANFSASEAFCMAENIGLWRIELSAVGCIVHSRADGVGSRFRQYAHLDQKSLADTTPDPPARQFRGDGCQLRLTSARRVFRRKSFCISAATIRCQPRQ